MDRAQGSWRTVTQQVCRSGGAGAASRVVACIFLFIFLLASMCLEDCAGLCILGRSYYMIRVRFW